MFIQSIKHTCLRGVNWVMGVRMCGSGMGMGAWGNCMGMREHG